MSEIEHTLVNDITSIDPGTLPEYLTVRSLGTSALSVAHAASEELKIVDRDIIQQFKSSWATFGNHSIGGQRAVIASMAAAENKWMYSGGTRSDGRIRFTELFPVSSHAMVEDVTEAFKLIKPNNEFGYSRVDVEKYCVDDPKADSRTEVVTFQGLNGCGKSTVLAAANDFAMRIGIVPDLIKFPRPDNDIGKLINLALEHKFVIDKKALQLLFLADFSDWVGREMKNDLVFADRFASLDGQVFSPPLTKLISLMVQTDLVDMRVTPIVIDRHPMACKSSRDARGTDARLFEKNTEQMAIQELELWKLLSLPGGILVNTDLPVDTKENLKNAIDYTMYRVVASMASAGIWTRALLKAKRFENHLVAREYVENNITDWFWEIRERSK